MGGARSELAPSGGPGFYVLAAPLLTARRTRGSRWSSESTRLPPGGQGVSEPTLAVARSG